MSKITVVGTKRIAEIKAQCIVQDVRNWDPLGEKPHVKLGKDRIIISHSDFQEIIIWNKTDERYFSN